MNGNNGQNQNGQPLYEQVMRGNQRGAGSQPYQGETSFHGGPDYQNNGNNMNGAKAGTMGRRGFGSRSMSGSVAEAMMNENATISRRAYNVIIGLIVLWGVGIDTAICYFFGDRLLETFNRNWAFILIYLGLVIGGTVIVNVAKNAVLSFVGFNLIVVGFGVTLAMVVGKYNPAIVTEAFLVTAIVTALMLLLGTLWQDMFKKIGRVLIVGLIGVIIVEIFMILFTGTYPTWISVVSAILFSGFIGYDWAQAQSVPATAKNAVLFATSLYVDIINLFLDILRIAGKDS